MGYSDIGKLLVANNVVSIASVGSKSSAAGHICVCQIAGMQDYICDPAENERAFAAIALVTFFGARFLC